MPGGLQRGFETSAESPPAQLHFSQTPHAHAAEHGVERGEQVDQALRRRGHKRVGTIELFEGNVDGGRGTRGSEALEEIKKRVNPGRW